MIPWINKFRISSVFFAVIFFLSLPFHVPAEESVYLQPDGILDFAYSLYRDRDFSRAYSEYSRYTFLYPAQQSDFINFMMGLCSSRMGNYTQARDLFSAVDTSNGKLRTAAEYETALTFLNEGQYRRSLDFLSKHTLPALSPFYDSGIISSFSYMYLGDWDNAALMIRETPSSLKNDIQFLIKEGRNAPRKSPWGAGILSALIPGAGKMYAERWKDGIFSFLNIGGLAGLSVYNFLQDGMDSVKGWIYAGIGGIFYIGNIYGSVKAALEFNSFQETRIKEEISNLLHSQF
jgi:TM2 domain-containing membrane protein YozV